MTDWRPNNAGAPGIDGAPTFQNQTGLRVGPMTLADIVDNSIKLFKAHWKQIGLVVLLFAIPSMIVNAVNTAVSGQSLSELVDSFSVAASSTDPDAVPEAGNSDIGVGGAITLVVLGLLVILVQPFVTGVISRIAAAAYFGESLSAGDAIRGLLKKWLTLLLASVLSGLTIFGACVVVAIPIGALAIVSPYFLVLLFLLLVPAIAVTTLLSLITPVIAIEETGAAKALSRSWSLVRRRFWPYLGTLIVMTIITTAFIFGVTAIFGVLQYVAENIWMPLAYVVAAISDFVSNAITIPIVAIAVTLLYFDARIRFEGFDLQVNASRLPSGSANPGVVDAPGHDDTGPDLTKRPE